MSISELKEKFAELNPRDQMMLIICAAAVLLYVLIFMVLMPMQDELAAERKRVHNAIAEQGRVQSLASRVLALQQSGQQVTNSNINSILNDSLRDYGLRMENFQPSGNSARVRLAAADFNQVLAWLQELEIKQGILIKDLTLTADNSPGAVLVNVQLQQGE